MADKIKRKAAVAPPGLDLPVATERVQVVDTSEQSNLDVLLDAVTFVSEGKMISYQTLEEVDRMLLQLQEKFDLVQVVYDHYMTQRLGVYLKRVQTVEDHIFNDPNVSIQERLAEMDIDTKLNLLKTMHARLDKVSSHIISKGSVASKGDLRTSQAAVKGVIENTVKQEEEGYTHGHTLPAEARQKVRHVLESLVNIARIDTKEEVRELNLNKSDDEIVQ